MKKIILCLLVLLILEACPHEPVSPAFEIKFNTVIKQNGQNVCLDYAYVHGMGIKDSLSIVKNWQSGLNNLQDSFLFKLPLNSNADSAYFIFRRDNLIQDTVGISYIRKFYVEQSQELYRYIPVETKLCYLSSRFWKDSCSVSSYSYLYEYQEKIGLYLVLKP